MKRHNLKNLAILLLITVTLGGCAVRVAYHFLDVAMLWSLDDYIDFEGDQRSQAKAYIKEFHRWHRYNELPEYAVNFDALADDLEGQVDVATIDHYAELLLAGWENIMRSLAPPSAQLLAQFDDDQIQGLVDTLAEEEEEDREDYAEESREDVLKERYDFMADTSKRLAGKLTEEQEAMIRQWAASLQDMDEMTLEQRSQWRQAFFAALQDRSDVEKLEQELIVLYTDPYRFWSDDYRQTMEYNQALTHQLLADLANSMTDKQRNKATKRLRNIASDFRALSKEK